MNKLKYLGLLLLIQFVMGNMAFAETSAKKEIQLIKYDNELNQQIRKNLIYPVQKIYITATYDLTIGKDGKLKNVALNSVYNDSKTTDKDLELFLDSAKVAINNSFPFKSIPVDLCEDHLTQVTFFIKPAKNQIIFLSKKNINSNKAIKAKQEAITKQIEKEWLPAYYSKKIYSIVSFNVNKNGSIENIKLLEASNYSPFDKLIMEFLQKTKLPPQSESIPLNIKMTSFGPDAKDCAKMITFTILSFGTMADYYIQYYGLNSL